MPISMDLAAGRFFMAPRFSPSRAGRRDAHQRTVTLVKHIHTPFKIAGPVPIPNMSQRRPLRIKHATSDKTTKITTQ